MRRRAVAAVAFLAMLTTPGAEAQDAPGTLGPVVRVPLVVSISGSVPPPDALAALRAQAGRLRRTRVDGCFGVHADVGLRNPAMGAHTVSIVEQRPGQFVRTSFEGSSDPYAGPRQVIVGELALGEDRALDGALPYLLAKDPPSATEGARALVARALEDAGARERLRPCRWSGALEIRAEYERYNLAVHTRIPFTFSVGPDGPFGARTEAATRAATAEDAQVGSCEGSNLAMFRVGLDVTLLDDDRFELRFTPRGDEPDFALDCAGGRVELGGDYVRIAFLPGGELVFRLRADPGQADADRGAELEGRRITTSVSIRRVSP